jgi:hypothetical protein
MSKLLEGSTEIRNRLGVSESTFMDLVLKHGLPARKGGAGVYKITEKDLADWEKTRGRAKDWYRVPETEKKPEEKAVMASKGKRGKSFRNKK